VEIFLYDEGAPEELNVEEIARYLMHKMEKVKVTARGSPFVLNVPEDRVSYFAEKIAGIKIQDVNQQLLSEQEPLYAEIEYEKRRILGKTRSFGILYDGFHLQKIFREVVPGEERNPQFVNILFTNRLFATWDDGDKRYHLRTSVYGIPCIISTTGIIEAPARPREYYVLKQQAERLGRDVTELKHKFKGGFIDYEDKRLTEVAKGYAMQAVFYSLTGEPFCEDKGCCLYNAHWQEELIFAQLGSRYEFCGQHKKILDELH